MSENAFQTLDLFSAQRELGKLHDLVLRYKGRIEITRGEDNACVLISKTELQGLENALAILSETESAAEMRCQLLRIAAAASGERAVATSTMS